jgi:hypothetical protein
MFNHKRNKYQRSMRCFRAVTFAGGWALSREAKTIDKAAGFVAQYGGRRTRQVAR